MYKNTKLQNNNNNNNNNNTKNDMKTVKNSRNKRTHVEQDLGKSKSRSQVANCSGTMGDGSPRWRRGGQTRRPAPSKAE